MATASSAALPQTAAASVAPASPSGSPPMAETTTASPRAAGGPSVHITVTGPPAAGADAAPDPYQALGRYRRPTTRPVGPAPGMGMPPKPLMHFDSALGDLGDLALAQDEASSTTTTTTAAAAAADADAAPTAAPTTASSPATATHPHPRWSTACGLAAIHEGHVLGGASESAAGVEAPAAHPPAAAPHGPASSPQTAAEAVVSAAAASPTGSRPSTGAPPTPTLWRMGPQAAWPLDPVVADTIARLSPRTWSGASSRSALGNALGSPPWAVSPRLGASATSPAAGSAVPPGVTGSEDGVEAEAEAEAAEAAEAETALWEHVASTFMVAPPA
ncbi:hypothetical protein CXG81DRAFT_20547 [Caulochytrium protostelioides]|uniref:Uncharacterized protein n=1 Tax=Caulochytrium protostelioides TaxID=1555241 RepID=A0A4P9X2E1_9FUNG|nr:hypothetical protein CXG81DRAFT_20547 [Caulochytrium protostelioides]|eukprot:RKO99353.1 hypothetical protein CXG81DRAFT_20547 [Caulochytrium protostelioides]